MNINQQARQRIMAAVCESQGCQLYRVVPLGGGERLLLAAQGGSVVYALLDAAGDLCPNTIRDVTLAVMAEVSHGEG